MRPRLSYGLGVESETRHELEATVAARRELGPAHDEELIAGFLDRIDREIDRRVDERVARKLPRKKGHGHSIALPSLGIAIPLIAIAGGTAGLAGVIAVCIAIVLVNVIHARA